jgi:hypothetical protein
MCGGRKEGTCDRREENGDVPTTDTDEKLRRSMIGDEIFLKDSKSVTLNEVS